MDCKTFDDHILDELYGELDEVTRAAMARHGESCGSSPSCGSKLAGLRSTREAVALEVPYVEPPDDLEDRILAATRDARPVVPLRRKMGGVVSWAGAWAMRPQTAMAAVFLLMIGSSLAFLRIHRSKSESSKAVAVSELGMPEPSPAGQAGPAQAEDRSAAGLAASPLAPPAVVAAAPASPDPSPPPSVPVATSAALASSPLDDALRGGGGGRGAYGGKDDALARPASKGGAAAASAMANDAFDESFKQAPDERGTSANAASDRKKEAVVASRAAAPSKPSVHGDREDLGGLGAAGGTGSGAPAAAPGSPPNGVTPAAQAASSDDAFTRGQHAYSARRFDEARDDFDAAASGNVAAALWAARSVRDGSGCAAAVSRFDGVVSRAPSSAVGFDARLEAGRCYRALGQTDNARARLVPLLTVPSHATRAQAELAAMAPPAAKKAAPSNTNGL